MKKDVLIREIKDYLYYDKALNEDDKISFINALSSNNNIYTGWMKVIYDYFDSHILEDGSIVSLEVYYLNNKDIDYDYYKQVNDKFVCELFKNNLPLYFIDVDNTMTDNGILSDEKKDFISKFEGRNRIILSTGKNYLSILNTIEDCNIKDNYSSSINGSVIVYKDKYESINKLGSISEEIIAKLLKTDLELITYYSDKIHLVRSLNEEHVNLLKQFNECYFDDVVDTDYKNIVKILLFIYDGDIESEQIVKDIVSDYKDLYCVRTSNHTYEVLRRDQHKGNTVKEISKRMGYYYRCSIGIGDSMNDLPMLNYTGKGYVVATASKELKSYGFEELEKNRKIDIVNLIKKYK